MNKAHVIFHLDTNLLNAKQGDEFINKLEEWHEKELITLVWSHTAQHEAKNNSKPHMHKKADTHIYTINEEADDQESNAVKSKNEIFKIMEIDENSTANEINDALIVSEAAKYCAILVTNDGASRKQPKGILGRRAELANHVRIMNASEAVNYIRSCFGYK
jgi:predicted nucleic acid-binding protein